jgi:Flp pilus assembly protein TadD
MSTPERIAQFEKMTAADPTNEMAHFSLGNAYLQAGRHAEAAKSLEKVIELSPGMSKAYQLCRR